MIYRSRVEVETPLAVSRRRATGNDIFTLPYLPGTVLRGALAQALLEADPQGNGERTEAFRELFLSGQVHFGDQRPGGAHPWPLSARQCKEHPEDHPVLDLLLDTRRGERRCSVCDGKLQQAVGFFHRTADSRGYETESVVGRRVAHVEIDPHLLRARNQRFHSAHVVCAGQVLKGQIWTADGTSTALEAATGEGRTLYVGRGKSRGQGRVRLTVRRDTDSGRIGDLAERIRKFHRDVRAKAPAWRGKIIFACTLQSPAILYDEWLFSRSSINSGDLGAGRGEPAAWFSRATEIWGWHAAGRLPKGGVAAIAAGSCFLFAQEGGDDVDYDRLAAALSAAEEQGIGERRAEGFGEVRICDPFHTDRAPGEVGNDA